MSKPSQSVCPTCSGRGYVFIADEGGVRRQILCGHSVCQGLLEERLATRIMHEIMRHLPPDITKGAKR